MKTNNSLKNYSYRKVCDKPVTLYKFVSVAIAILLFSCVTAKSWAAISLQEAIEQSAGRIASDLPRGTRVAIVAFKSEHNNLSDHIMGDLAKALYDRKIEVADRQNLKYLYGEQNLPYVSEESAPGIGKILGANIVITGEFINIGSIYRYRIRAIHTESAINLNITSFDVRNDQTLQDLIRALVNGQITIRDFENGVTKQTKPETAVRFLDLGMMYARLGEHNEAILNFTEAIGLDPNFAVAYYNRGLAYFNKGDYDRAIADFDQAIRLDPKFERAHVERGRIYYNRGNYDRAIAYYNEAIGLDPNFADAYYNRGLAYFNKGDYDRAIADYTQAIRLNPNYADAYNNRGSAYFMKGDYDRAIADYEAALRIDPNHANAKQNLEIARRARGR